MAINIRKAVTDALELPREVILNLPLVSVIGREEVLIENYKGIVEYSEEKIRINTTVGILKIIGTKLFLNSITADNISVTGNISSIEFLV